MPAELDGYIPVTDVARDHGCSPPWVWKLIHQLGVVPVKRWGLSWISPKDRQRLSRAIEVRRRNPVA